MTMPMLAPCQVVLVDGAETIQSRAKDGDDSGDADDGDDPRKDTLKALAEYLAKPAPFTVIVFEVRNSITVSVSTKCSRKMR